MMPSNQNLQNFARAFSEFVRSTVHILIWAVIGFVGVAAAYVGVRAVMVAVKTILRALGI
jgi:hypothetical protein